MCFDFYESEEAEQAHRRWKRRAGSLLFFITLVAGMLIAFFLLAPPAPAVDPLLRSVF